MKKSGILICLLLASLPFFQLSAQKSDKKITISGTVLDKESKPLQNAMIMIDGVKTNKMTDDQGHYLVKVKPYARTIGVVAFGSGVIEQDISDRTEINFYFNANRVEKKEADKEAPSDNMVNTGYNSVEKEKLTTSVGKVKNTRAPRTYANIFEMLQTVPGVKVTGTRVVVNDARDFQGTVDPLFVVDGVPVTSIDDISPATVASIEVLKGSAASIYGTRGYGGVILIKRKSLE